MNDELQNLVDKRALDIDGIMDYDEVLKHSLMLNSFVVTFS